MTKGNKNRLIAALDTLKRLERTADDCEPEIVSLRLLGLQQDLLNIQSDLIMRPDVNRPAPKRKP